MKICENCVYFDACGDIDREMPCDGRKEKEMKVRTVKEACIDRYLNGEQDLQEVATEIHKAGYFNYIPSESETLEWMFGKANPYYIRNKQRRHDLAAVLQMAKANGCECYITKHESGYDYGYMIFSEALYMGNFVFPLPDVIMYIQNGDFWGWDFSIEYIPSRENGTGCRCNEESVCSIDWNGLLQQKADGLAFARKLGAKLYRSADEWKAKKWNFEELIKL